MPAPASSQNEPSKLKKLIAGDMKETIRSKLPPENGSSLPAGGQAPQPRATVVSSPQKAREPRFRFLPALWTIASLLSLIVNIVLIVVVLVLFQYLGDIQRTANDKASGLLGGLYENFVRMDQANIRTTIHVEKEIPVQFSLTVTGPTTVRLTQPVRIDGATVTVHTGGMNITNAQASIILPSGLPLPVQIESLTVPVDQKVLAVLDVPVDIPLEQTELHEPFLGLQEVVKPWYCLIEPNATLDEVPICSQLSNTLFPAPAPAGTVIP